MTTPLLVHPDVLAVLRAVLRRHGVCKQDLDDAVADVQTRALESFARRSVPVDVSGMKALVARVARNYAIDRGRKRLLRARHDVGLCEDPDLFAPLDEQGAGCDPVDAARQLDVVRELLERGAMPEHADAILEGVVCGESFAAIGQELGLSAHAVEGRVRKMRRLAQERPTAA